MLRWALRDLNLWHLPHEGSAFPHSSTLAVMRNIAKTAASFESCGRDRFNGAAPGREHCFRFVLINRKALHAGLSPQVSLKSACSVLFFSGAAVRVAILKLKDSM